MRHKKDCYGFYCSCGASWPKVTLTTSDLRLLKKSLFDAMGLSERLLMDLHHYGAPKREMARLQQRIAAQNDLHRKIQKMLKGTK